MCCVVKDLKKEDLMILRYQYSKTNVMHLLFNLFRIKGFYMFRALLAHLQQALQKRHWYIACVLCQLAAPGLEWFHSKPGAAN
jgi:hypothetical protein